MEFIDHAPRRWLPRATLERFGRRASALRLRDDPNATGFDRAIDHFEHGRWSEAFDALVPLAESGDREAARIALLMAVRGRRLFGQTFAATPSQRESWREVADGGAPA